MIRKALSISTMVAHYSLGSVLVMRYFVARGIRDARLRQQDQR